MKADLSHANLSGASFIKADLSHANLCHTNLCGANLKIANLCDTKFLKADLCGAIFWDKELSWEAKNITPEQIKKAKNWEKGIYSPEFRKKLGLPPEE
ncbi:MAG: pentapeptide repeat-containing protein [Rivularia sp. (in: cyanobacteria)]